MRKITKQHRIIIVIVAILLAIVLILAVKNNFWTSSAPAQDPICITTVPVSTMNKPIRITKTGSVQNAVSFPIRTETAGQISEIYVSEGQAVKAGQPLLKIQASAMVPVSTSITQTSEPTDTVNTSPETSSEYENALKEYNRYQRLFEIGAIPRRQLDMASERLQQAKDNLNAPRPTAGSMPSTANGNVTSSSDASITLSAPIDGLITGLSAAAGSIVQAGQLITSIGSGQALEVITPIEQNDLYLIHLGSPVLIEAAQQTIQGLVSRIDPQIAENQVTSFLAHMKYGNSADTVLTPDTAVQIQLDTGQTTAVSAIPTSTIMQDEKGQNYIYLAVNGKAVRKRVSIGETIGDLTEITSNISNDSLVINSSLEILKDGDLIEIVQQ